MRLKKNNNNFMFLVVSGLCFSELLMTEIAQATLLQSFTMVELGSMSNIATPASSPIATDATAVNVTYGQGAINHTQAQAAFGQAVTIWEKILHDTVEINLSFDYASLGANILGQASSILVGDSFDYVRNLVSDNLGEVNNSYEAEVLPALPDSSNFSAYSDYTMNSAYLTQANYHALGGSETFHPYDTEITFSSDFAWDFDRSDGISAGTYDFTGVALHEIGHGLGFISNVDFADYLLENNQTPDSYFGPTTLDLFRFEGSDLNASFNFTTSPRDLTPGGDDYMYIGDDLFVAMSTGQYNGNGRQASHWLDNFGLGIMDPTGSPGELFNISEYDLRALDLIGWDVDYSYLSVPEPASMLLYGIGLAGLVGTTIRRKKYPSGSTVAQLMEIE